MKYKLLYIIPFLLIILAQWLVPMQMINEQEDVLQTGKIYKFKTAPVDPYDAFRGKYINLNFANNRIQVKSTKGFDYNIPVYLTFKDSSGYAIVNSISKTEPKNTTEYIKAKVSYIDYLGTKNFVVLDFPFNRYYMNEFKAPKAEESYSKVSRDIKKNVYAIVAIKNGIGIVKEVIIDDVSIKKYVEKLEKN
jgi:uncharacterized membrane-anchored protein